MFLKKHGEYVCLAAIKRHRAKHRDRFREVRETAAMAEAYCRVLNRHGGSAFVGAAQGRFESMLMKDLMEMDDKPKLNPEEWATWAVAINKAANTRKNVAELQREEYERRAKEALKVAEKVTGKDVVMRMKEILGV
jgi:hypothetical protein